MAYEQSLYNEVALQYEEIRRQNEHDLALRCENVYKKLPELESIDADIKNLGLKLFKLAISNSADLKSDIQNLRLSQKALLAKRKELLEANGFSDDELSMRYMCDICRDTGIANDTYCECFKRKLVLKAYEKSNLSSQLKSQSFKTFDLSLYSKDKLEQFGVSPFEQMTKIYKICLEYSKGGSGHNNMLFWGPPGIGKTFISTCIAKEFIKNGKSVIYDTAYKIFSLLEDYKFKSTQKNIEELTFKIDRLYECDLLILDDLGAEFKTAYSNAAFFDILNTRLNSDKKTIINTNLSMRELSERYSERTISRLMGSYMVLQFIGDDIRLKKSPNC